MSGQELRSSMEGRDLSKLSSLLSAVHEGHLEVEEHVVRRAGLLLERLLSASVGHVAGRTRGQTRRGISANGIHRTVHDRRLQTSSRPSTRSTSQPSRGKSTHVRQSSLRASELDFLGWESIVARKLRMFDVWETSMKDYSMSDGEEYGSLKPEERGAELARALEEGTQLKNLTKNHQPLFVR